MPLLTPRIGVRLLDTRLPLEQGCGDVRPEDRRNGPTGACGGDTAAVAGAGRNRVAPSVRTAVTRLAVRRPGLRMSERVESMRDALPWQIGDGANSTQRATTPSLPNGTT
ncbi:hypothetical protein Pflav_029280 [Phytohabitans flavus]|uniref:Uncharacterized protein n=1 Tax=Phytohabitans flavus TaxID=1076124 RepID=A0A6F8XRZ1_9ACTN|nr:hypothetical protein Pflav_029280 [Phytohabitans flavus]